ncbi:hypothetical protein IB642_06825 [Allofrancisella guangzhouensis]|uniref:Alpha/beta hydrolase n=1 Tax=Allofrancisella guangzhouensis TaxID=594679 RepID=A0A0A8E9H2_9GAMM|nr:hypothetical protein [Allofrancisella guangzhouensis]AJC48826.1 hypothetical protein SD28_03850 [Allofrancisella guangzhouensis]MBK2027277.1 hypothetical protein [Allofrancisella guangzhouensis]MBK2044731.1 hypothetical protein [Allofrancisella guangzhouensis]MBK2045927.1 hypothetical protein [Allofrancisella guangzhouensis]
MNVLVIRGYYSKGDSVEHCEINGLKVKITTVALGSPIFVRRKLNKIINKYQVNAQNYDLIYAISMSAGISSLLDKKLYCKLHLVTPFFIHYKTMLVLRKVKFRKFLGAYLLLLLNGSLGKLNKAIRITLAENDDIVDNKFFQRTFDKYNIIKGSGHTLSDEVIHDIIKKDIENIYPELKFSSDHAAS